jgi:hypothetical protein
MQLERPCFNNPGLRDLAMNQIFRRFRQIPLFVRVLLIGLGFAALLSLALAAPELDPSPRAAVQPPVQRPLPRPESHPVAGPLTLVSLEVGPKPWVRAPGRSVVSTFTSDDPETLLVAATARLRSGLDPSTIRWTVSAPLGFVVPVEGMWTGPRLEVKLRRPGGNPVGLGGPLALMVQATVAAEGAQHSVQETVVQDEVDQLRQEYIDLARRQVPARGEFVNAVDFAARYGQRFPWLRFEDLNWSVDPNTRERFSYALIRPELIAGLDRMRRAYGDVTINSGYRNPTRQVEVHAPVRESLHQYGYAADLAVAPGGGRAWPSEVDWRRLAEVACGASAKWVEPLTSSSPNGPGCHVHVDYRPGPASSAPVRLRGQVVAAATGRPVADALVVLGGMPARTDAGGFFVIRNVMSGGRYPVDVQAEGYAPLEQPVWLKAWGTVTARLALQLPTPDGVNVAVASTSWLDEDAGLLAVGLSVSNAGSSPADVRVGLSSSAARLSLASTLLAALPAGGARQVALTMRLPRGKDRAPLPLSVDLAFRPGSGQEKRRRASLLAPLPALAQAVSPVPAAPPPRTQTHGQPAPVVRPAPVAAALSSAELKPAAPVAAQPAKPSPEAAPAPAPVPAAEPAPPSATGEAVATPPAEKPTPPAPADESDLPDEEE